MEEPCKVDNSHPFKQRKEKPYGQHDHRRRSHRPDRHGTVGSLGSVPRKAFKARTTASTSSAAGSDTWRTGSSCTSRSPRRRFPARRSSAGSRIRAGRSVRLPADPARRRRGLDCQSDMAGRDRSGPAHARGALLHRGSRVRHGRALCARAGSWAARRQGVIAHLYYGVAVHRRGTRGDADAPGTAILKTARRTPHGTPAPGSNAVRLHDARPDQDQPHAHETPSTRWAWAPIPSDRNGRSPATPASAPPSR